MKMNSSKVKVIVAVCVLALGVASVVGVSLFRKKSNADAPSNKAVMVPQDVASVNRDTSISINNGVLEVNRNQKVYSPMGEDGTWTILMYFCGSNLESQYSAATRDFKEMLSCKYSEEVLQRLNIIIQTCGCREWQSNSIASDKIGRYRVTNSDKLELIDTLEDGSSGSPITLTSFLEWGVEKYPAKNMGVIIWDHGSGPVYGVCGDDKFNRDALTLQEMEYSFAKVSRKMSSRFEFIGFDTCLSGNIEFANAFTPYANYMIASAQTEPGDGWNYTPIINYLIDNKNATGAELGKVICDSYMDYYEGKEAKNELTIATYDLNKTDKAMVELNYLTKYLSDAISSNPECAVDVFDMITDRVRFGTFGELIDIGSIMEYLDKTDKFNYDTRYLKAAFNDLVSYKKMSNEYSIQNAMGITMYLPKDVISYNLLLMYRNACFSPYHMSLIEKLAYAKSNYDWKDYIDYDWTKSPFFYEKTFSFLNYVRDDLFYEPEVHNAMMSVSEYANDGFLEAWYNNFSLYSPIHKKTFNRNAFNVKFDKNIQKDKKNYSATIDEASKKYVDAVYSSIFVNTGNDLLCLGENIDVSYNEKNGTIKSKFNGEWFTLPDGQYLTTYVVSYDADTKTTIYSIPVVINDVESSIRIKQVSTGIGYDYICLGVWDATSNSGYAPRGYLPLEVGTTITPIYDIYIEKDNKYESEYGEEYTIKKDFDFLFSKLPKGNYSYGYTVSCINGQNIYSDLETFEIK